jgi:hypothetical protein
MEHVFEVINNHGDLLPVLQQLMDLEQDVSVLNFATGVLQVVAQLLGLL